jgi:hypothetical protein
MTSLFLGSYRNFRVGRHGHFFWRSVSGSQYLHIKRPSMFDVDRWFHFALPASIPREALEDIVQGMEEARAAWLQHAQFMLLSHPSHELRDMLGRSGNLFSPMNRMNDHQVARALYEDVKDGHLLFVPELDEMRKCVRAIREQREKGSGPGPAPARAQQPADADVAKALYGNSPHGPQNLGNARPFDYQSDIADGDVMQLTGADGRPRNNQAQNKQFKAVVKALGLSQDQARQLHDYIQDDEELNYHGLLDNARSLFGGQDE